MKEEGVSIAAHPPLFPSRGKFSCHAMPFVLWGDGYELGTMSCEYFLLMVQPSFTFDCYIIGMRRRSAIVQASLVLRATLYVKKRAHLPKT